MVTGLRGGVGFCAGGGCPVGFFGGAGFCEAVGFSGGFNLWVADATTAMVGAVGAGALGAAVGVGAGVVAFVAGAVVGGAAARDGAGCSVLGAFFSGGRGGVGATAGDEALGEDGSGSGSGGCDAVKRMSSPQRLQRNAS
ncbi:MAG TPA: hypothetical protein VFQ35_26960 [Polyangiaceae bacterium]|nr:hypothetical protein [Polyangiaceae bacterium]